MTRCLPIAIALLLTLPGAALAATHPFQTAGPHVGFSSSPGQVVFGGQLEFAEVAPELDFVPGVDLGVGDHETVVSLNADLHYRITLQGSQWQPYAGAGASLHFVSVDVSGPATDKSATVGGGSLILGAVAPTKSGNRFFAEIKLGLGDGPSFKGVAGWHFHLR